MQKHAGPAPAGESSEGVAGDVSGFCSLKPVHIYIDRFQVSLLEYLDLGKLNCLNESPNHTAHSVLSSRTRNKSSNYLLSEADDQLLLNIVVSSFFRCFFA